MQTFLVDPDFKYSVSILDNRRLNKQILEAMQIYRSIVYGSGWRNHPIVKMWRSYPGALLEYGLEACNEWVIKRKRSHVYRSLFLSELAKIDKIIYPSWLGNKEFHDSHKSNLLRKDPVFYGRYRWGVKSDLPYVWIT